MNEFTAHTIYEWVEIPSGVVLEAPVIIGKPCSDHPEKTSIGDRSIIRSFSVIYENVSIGEDTSLGHAVVIREGNRIGNNCKIGTKAVLEPGNVVGDRSRIHTACFMENVVIEEDVFVGPHVVFTDDPHPPCPKYLDCKKGAIVRKMAKIGANATILPGVIIGEQALIGAGSVVTKDIPAFAVAIGNPAVVTGDVREIDCDHHYFDHAYQWEPYSLERKK